MDLKRVHQAANELYDRLRLATVPVAVRYLQDLSEIPDGFVRPSQRGQTWSLCQAFTHARKHRMNVAMTAEDNFCLASTLAHGWFKLPLEDLIQSQRLNLWRKDMEAELAAQSLFMDLVSPQSRETMKNHVGFLVSPLNAVPFVPDSVLIYGNPAQVTHLIQALTYDGKHLCVSPFNGFGESCIKGALLPHVTGKPQVVIPGAGDRAFSGTGDDETALGMPAAALFSVQENLFRSGGPFNLGYPARAPLVAHLTEDILPGWSYIRKRLEQEKKKDAS
jgi:uncharacterized protein (DUF169 family)